MRKMLVLLLITVFVTQFSACNIATNEPTSVTSESTPTPTPTPYIEEESLVPQQSNQTIEQEPSQAITPPTSSAIDNTNKLFNDTSIISTDGNEITVHNINELLYHLSPDKHFKLMPGGDYDLFNADSSIKSEYFSYGTLLNLSNVTIEGLGDKQVDIITHSSGNVLDFAGCSGITLINLNIGHDSTNKECLGDVLVLGSNCSNITIHDCTLFGCGRIGINADSVSDIKCENSVIRDCTYQLIHLSNVNDVVFENCLFHTRFDQDIIIDSSKNVRISSSELSGDYCNYPKILANDLNIIEAPSEGPVYKITDISNSGITLENDHISGLNALADLNNLFPGVSASVYCQRDEISGFCNIDFNLKYSEKPEQSEYISQYNTVRSIGTKYGFEDVAIFLCDMDNIIFVGDGFFDNYLYCYADNPDIGTILNDGKTYLTVEQADKIVTDWFPHQKFIDGQDVPSTEELTISHGGMRLLGDTAYYCINIKTDNSTYYFFVNAVDGTITQYFDGIDFAPVESATQEQIDAVLNYLRSIGSNRLKETYRAYIVNGSYIKFNRVPYVLKSDNGTLIADIYDEWTGD